MIILLLIQGWKCIKYKENKHQILENLISPFKRILNSI